MSDKEASATEPKKVEKAAAKPRRKPTISRKKPEKTPEIAAAAEKPEAVEAAAPAEKETKAKAPKAPRKKTKADAKKAEQEAKAVQEKALMALREYVFLGVTMEELAEKYGLSGWEELYELYKKTPASEIWA